MKLPFVKEGRAVKVQQIIGGASVKKRLEEIGIFPGKELIVLKSGHGPVLIRIENRKIGLGFGEAMKIEVE